MRSPGTIAGATVAQRDVAVLSLPTSPSPCALRVTNPSLDVQAVQDAPSPEPLDLLLVAGQRQGQNPHKILGHGGALIGSSEQQARRLMDLFEASEPEAFGWYQR